MIFLQLFFTFFMIGLFTFGGGYGAIPLVQSEIVKAGWLSEGEILTLIGVSEATPGPFAINIATFVGSTQGGFFGAACATLGFIMPSILIILIVAVIFQLFMKSRLVKGMINGIMPAVVGLILVNGLFIIFDQSHILSFDFSTIDLTAIGIMLNLGVLMITYSKVTKKKPNPIVIILIAAAMGIVVYSL